MIGFVTGYTARELGQYKHTYVLNDIQILKHFTPEEKYLLAFKESHVQFVTKFCSDYVPVLQEGATLKILVYEDRGECWSVADKKLGFKYERAYLKGE